MFRARTAGVRPRLSEPRLPFSTIPAGKPARKRRNEILPSVSTNELRDNLSHTINHATFGRTKGRGNASSVELPPFARAGLSSTLAGA
jgi:hypothetical protein